MVAWLQNPHHEHQQRRKNGGNRILNIINKILMTFEQNVDYEALNLISKEKKYSNNELINLFSQFLTSQKAAELHAKFVKNEYYKQEIDGVPEYMINGRALFYLTYLQKEKDREEIDLKLKKISYGSIKFNKYFPFFALIVSALAITVTIILKSC